MTFFISDSIDLKIIVASLSGALVHMLTQQHFSGFRQSVAFCVSFSMGIIGADATLELVNKIAPDTLSNNERAIGAFLCSALVVTAIIKLISYIDVMSSGNNRKGRL